MENSQGSYGVCGDLFVSKLQKPTSYMRLRIYSRVVFFSISLKKYGKRLCRCCIVSDVLPQNTEALSREFEAKKFCCSSPKNPFKGDEEDRMGALSKSWYDQERPTTREMVGVDFYCIGFYGRVRCFHCDGQLFLWKPCDNPLYKQVKCFPMCKFVLKKSGVKSMKTICQKHSDLHRPDIKNPTRSIAANHLRNMVIQCETRLQQKKEIKD